MAGMYRTAGSSGELSVVHRSTFGAQEGPWVLGLMSYLFPETCRIVLSCRPSLKSWATLLQLHISLLLS